MIAKVVIGDDFAAVLRYASRKGPLLATNIVSPFGSWDVGPLASEMQLYATCRYDVRKPVLHVAIRLPLQDAMRLVDADFLSLAKQFMGRMEIDRNRHQWVVYKHDPDHVHLIVNRIDVDRNAWRNSFAYLRAMCACRELEGLYGLTPVTSALDMTKILLTRGELAMEARTGRACPKRVIYRAVNRGIVQCGSLDDLESMLAAEGISRRVKPGKGVSFAYDGIAFQGRRISRCCSLESIERRIAEREAPEEEAFHPGPVKNVTAIPRNTETGTTGRSMRDSKRLRGRTPSRPQSSGVRQVS